MKKLLLTSAIFSALTLSSFGTIAAQAGDIVVRGGATLVDPDSNKATVNLDGAASPLQVSVDDNTQLGLNFVYYFDSNWAVEVLAATPFKHDIVVHDPQGVLGVDGMVLAETEHLPPTISAIYQFDVTNKLKPYVGLGVNYTIFFEEEFKLAPDNFTNLDLDGSLGWSAQVGADYYVNDNWMVNASIRYIDINTDATFDTDILGPNMKGSADVDIDPMVYSLMIGYKF